MSTSEQTDAKGENPDAKTELDAKGLKEVTAAAKNAPSSKPASSKPSSGVEPLMEIVREQSQKAVVAFVTAGRPVQHTSVVPHDRHVRFPAVPVDDRVVDLVLVDFAQQ